MSKLKIALTTGDTDGIGFEVTAKALNLLGPQKNVQFFLWRSDSATSARYLKLIDRKFERITVDSLEEALKIEGPYLVDIASDLAPALWVEETAKACMKKQLDGMATAPLSKTGIRDAGLRDLGHTDILKRISKASAVRMGFVGSQFNVVLSTAHIPLKKVSAALTPKVLQDTLVLTNELRLKLPAPWKNKPVALLGLNPHAGEEAMLGSEEQELFPALQAFAKKNKIPLSQPLVPDAAFFPENWKKYSAYMALYHDQGLIPFKMIHGQRSGVHISLGLPFTRTSVDHGTAKDIFGKDEADPHSMLDALRWSVKLSRLNRG